ncbi:MAG: hypothetical protein FWD79_04865 [Desulfobulbus sp.]|nr:hypothetical protein [Desulfobulbus sp.]
MITNIDQNQLVGILSAYQNNSSDAASRSSLSAKNSGLPTIADTVNLQSESTSPATYSGGMRLSANDGARLGMLQNLVVNLLQQQGVNSKIAVGDSTIDLATITPKEAQDLVAEDGYFGVEKTSERIVQFAVGVAGGDPARIDAIKAGIDKGFAEAKKAFGDWLPDISYNTYDAVMRKLDEWVAGTTAAA